MAFENDSFLDDAAARKEARERLYTSSDFAAEKAQSWKDNLDDLPKTDEDYMAMFRLEMSNPESVNKFKESVRQEYLKDPRFLREPEYIRTGFQSGDPVVTKAVEDSGFNDFLQERKQAFIGSYIDKKKQAVAKQRQILEDSYSDFIRHGGVSDTEFQPQTLTPEQKEALDAGKTYFPTFPQAVAETRSSGAFKGMTNESAMRWGLEGPSFEQQQQLEDAISAETNENYRVVLTELRDNWQRERVGAPKYQNPVFDVLDRGANAITAPIYGVAKYAQGATQQAEQEFGGKLSTIFGIDPVIALEAVARDPGEAATEILENTYSSYKESVMGSSDSAANLAGLISSARDTQEAMARAETEKWRKSVMSGGGEVSVEEYQQQLQNEYDKLRGKEVLGETVLDNPMAAQQVLQMLPGTLSLAAKGVQAVPKGAALAKRAIQATGLVPEGAETAAKATTGFFTRNRAAKELGETFGAVQGAEEGVQLSNTLEAAKEFGLGQKAKFVREQEALGKAAKDVSEQATEVGQQAAGAHTFATLGASNLAKGTNSSVAATKLAAKKSAETGIKMGVVDDPEIVKAYSKYAGTDVSHVVLPEQYVNEVKEITGALSKAGMINKRSEAGALALRVAETIEKEVWTPSNNIARNFYLALPRTPTRNIISNAEILSIKDPSGLSPVVQGQLLKQWGKPLTDPKVRAEIGMLTDNGKTLTNGEISDFLHNYNLLQDTGRIGEIETKAGKLNPLRYAEKVSAVVGTPSRVASQAGDTWFKVSAALSELKRVGSTSPEAAGKILKHVEKVAGLYSRMNSNADKIGKTATFAWSWNAYILPNIVESALKDPKFIQRAYRFEQAKQAYGQVSAREGERLPPLKSALGKYDIDKIISRPEDQKLLLSRTEEPEVVMSRIDTPLDTLAQFLNEDADRSISGAAPLGLRPIWTVLTGMDWDTDKPVDKGIKVDYTSKTGAIKSIKSVGKRLEEGAYEATGPAYQAAKDLFEYYLERGEPQSAVDVAKHFRMENQWQPLSWLGKGQPGQFKSVFKPKNKNFEALEKSKPVKK